MKPTRIPHGQAVLPWLLASALSMSGCGGGAGGTERTATESEFVLCPVGSGQFVPAPAPDGFWAKNAQAGTPYSGMSHFGVYGTSDPPSWQRAGPFSATPQSLQMLPQPVGAPADATLTLPSTGTKVGLDRACSAGGLGTAGGRLYEGQIDTQTQLQLTSFGGGQNHSWSDFGVIEVWAGQTRTSGSTTSWSGTERRRAGVFAVGALTPASGVPGAGRPDWWPSGATWTGQVTYVGTIIGWAAMDWAYTSASSSLCLVQGIACPIRRQASAVQGTVTVQVDFSTGRITGGSVDGLVPYTLDLDTGRWTAASKEQVNPMAVGVATLSPLAVDPLAMPPANGVGFVSGLTLARKASDCSFADTLCDLSRGEPSASISGVLYGPKGQELGGVLQVASSRGDVILGFSALPALPGR